MELDDSEVLTQLRLRRLRLKLELDRVELAIKAFEEVVEFDELEVAVYMIDEAFDDTYKESALMYNPKHTVEKKILYALAKLHKADAREVAQYLIRIDGHIKDDEKFYERVTYMCSRLFKLGKIGGERIGRKNTYKLNIVN